MKKIMMWVALLLEVVSAFGQEQIIEISTGKTTSIVLPGAIRHIDRGIRDMIVQQIKEAETVLLVKATRPGFPETNLSVITADGCLYSFLVRYQENPCQWVYEIKNKGDQGIADYAIGVLDNPAVLKGAPIKRKWDMTGKVSGIYIREPVIYYQLRIENDSPIDYDIDLMRFYIRDNKKSRKTALQENELKPLYIAGNTKKVEAFTSSTIVVALDKFTIPDAKHLVVEIIERNGGRHLLLKIRNQQYPSGDTATSC